MGFEETALHDFLASRWTCHLACGASKSRTRALQKPLGCQGLSSAGPFLAKISLMT